MDIPNLDEPDNWMAIAAILALVLSQLPPLLPLLWGQIRGGRVLLSTQDTVGLSHHLGRVFVLLYVQVENVGPRPVTVAKIDCILRRLTTGDARPRRSLWRLPVRSYLPGDGRFGLFVGTIRLSPGESWQEVVRCYGPRAEDEEEEAQQLQDDFADYIGRELERRQAAGGEDAGFVEVSQELVDRARSSFDRMFDLTRGEYELYLAALDRRDTVLGATKLRFIVYENTILSLRRIVDDYRFGFGVSEGAPPYRRAHAEPRLTLVATDRTARDEYLRITSSP